MAQSPVMFTRACACVASLILLAAASDAQMVRPAQDAGAAGAWAALLKVRTTASAMHTTAHPDDEQGGVLALLSRGTGAKVSLLTLNRGEAGDNAIGPELFDALGLIRTEELLDADTYYGVDRQYFTPAVDYGFSKRLDEALDKWGRENVLGDVVRIIRRDRPLVLISRFQGTSRDGHGNHQTAGLITRDAFRAAGDPARFPDQIAEGLRPWQPLKLYIGGVRENENWTLGVDTGRFDPVLGRSFQNVSRTGLAYQRSQNGGAVSLSSGPSFQYYERLESLVDAPDKEQSFFDGVDTTVPGTYRTLRRAAPPEAAALLAGIDRETQAAVQAFTIANPSASAPPLARALAATRQAIDRLGGDADVRFLLEIKDRQLQDALVAALGVTLTAGARPATYRQPASPFAPPPTMGPVVAGQTFAVDVVFANPQPDGMVEELDLALTAPRGWRIEPDAADTRSGARRFTVTVAADAAPTFPYFHRSSPKESRYTIDDDSQMSRPVADPPLAAVARFRVGGVPVDTRTPVTRLEPNLPYGHTTHVLAVVPALAVNLAPAQAIVPLSNAAKSVTVRVELVNNHDGQLTGTLRFRLPQGWTARPDAQPFTFAHAGERAQFTFAVSAASLESREYRLEAVATANGREYRQGYLTIEHRDLETRYLPREAVTIVRGVNVDVAPALKIGYVMGIGDDVPSAIAQLGAQVRLLAREDLATGDLRQFDAIVTGTRAYAVREDLKTYNRRLLDYVRDGGNLIVLYNTQELVPGTFAPFPGTLPADAEEVSEENSPVQVLAADEPVLNQPNRISPADFDGWVEQRGSKFWSEWDGAYTPVIATWDTGQAPQRGGWLHARYGKGHYTYFAYALHRQLPYSVPGAYRILANLLSLGKATEGAGR